MVSQASTLSGCRVLVTGHTGFKGSWLCLLLGRLGARVYGMALCPSSETSLFAAARIGELLDEDHRCDVREQASVRRCVLAVKPDVILHLAAQSLVLPSYQDPVGTFAINIMGTAHVLAAACDTPGIKGVLVVTTDKVYENAERGVRFREDDALGGYDPYSASKAGAEIVAASWRRSFAVRRTPPVAIATARSGNVIGGGDWAPHRLLPDCIRAFSAGRPVELRRPWSIRPWQHVLDPLCGYLTLAAKLVGEDRCAYADGWNFGPRADESLSVHDMARLAAKTWGDAATIVLAPDTDPPHEVGILKLDASKAYHRLAWEPRWDAARAMAEAVAWYRDVAGGRDARACCLAQIEAHEAGR